MKRLFILTTFLLGISPICLNAQELTLEECQQQAQAHYPLIKRYGLIEKTKEYNISNAGKGYLPQVSLSAKASYQSDVTEIPVDLPGIDIRGIRKDQYQAMLQLDQVVWDGGNIRARKEVTRATSEVDKQKLEVDMYAINERVNQLFFGILLLKEQLKQNQLMQEELQRKKCASFCRKILPSCTECIPPREPLLREATRTLLSCAPVWRIWLRLRTRYRMWITLPLREGS